MDDKKIKKENMENPTKTDKAVFEKSEASYHCTEAEAFSARRASDDEKNPFAETSSDTVNPETTEHETVDAEVADNEEAEAPVQELEDTDVVEESKIRKVDAKKATRTKRTSLKKKVWLTVVLDILFIGLGLNVFALLHHVIPSVGMPAPVVRPELTHTPSAVTGTPMPQATGDTQFYFEGVFLEEGQKEQTETVYKSENVSVELTYHEIDGLRYYVQDVYVRKIDYLKTAFAEDTYGRGFEEHPVDMAVNNNAVCAVSGDYYGARRKSAVIRNGVLYRDSTYNDVCVLYHNGIMRVIDKEEFDGEQEILNGAYQAWDFGPNLLDENGKAITKFISRILGKNPRCAIGYYEPGHYCFVVVDGRGANDSEGLTLAELAALLEGMGCKAAYNLDGGKTACMVMYDSMINEHLDSDCRDSSDIVMITDFE